MHNRPIREILHRTPGCSLTSSGPLASLGETVHKQGQKTQAVSRLLCCLQNQPHNAVSLSRKEGSAASQGKNHPSTTTCLSPQSACPLWKCRMLRPPSVQGPLSASLQGLSLALLKLSTGMAGLPTPVVLPLASRPFKPAFMSLSVRLGRPRCQASFTQLQSSQDTMLSSVCRQRHFHGKGSELNPLLILSETPCQADTVC